MKERIIQISIIILTICLFVGNVMTLSDILEKADQPPIQSEQERCLDIAQRFSINRIPAICLKYLSVPPSSSIKE